MTKESIWFIYLWPFSHLTFSTSEEESASNGTFVDELFVYYISQRLSSWFPICTYIKTRKNRWACTFSLIALCFLTLYLNRKMPSSFGLGNYSESNVSGKKRKEKTSFFENKLVFHFCKTLYGSFVYFLVGPHCSHNVCNVGISKSHEFKALFPGLVIYSFEVILLFISEKEDQWLIC